MRTHEGPRSSPAININARSEAAFTNHIPFMDQQRRRCPLRGTELFCLLNFFLHVFLLLCFGALLPLLRTVTRVTELAFQVPTYNVRAWLSTLLAFCERTDERSDFCPQSRLRMHQPALVQLVVLPSPSSTTPSLAQPRARLVRALSHHPLIRLGARRTTTIRDA